MPYTPSAEGLVLLREQALADQEIRDKLDASDCNEAEVAEFIDQRAKDIWASAGSQIGAFNEAEKAAATIEARYKSLAEHKPLIVSFYRDFLPAAPGFLILSLLALFSSTVRHVIAVAYGNLGPWGTLSGLLILAGVLLLARWVMRYKFKNYDASLEEGKQQLAQANTEMNKLRALIEPAIMSSVVGLLRELFDSRSTPLFRLDLPDTDTARLSEVPNPQFDIITDSRRSLSALVDKMNGGSIGVAGPRGCGKTTLLRSFCPEGNVNPKELSIFATAPVQYEPREFLLQLFTFICSRVIAKETRTNAESTWTEMDSLREMSTERLLDAGLMASILLIGSVFLLAVGLFVGAVQAILPGGSGSGDTQKLTAAKDSPSVAEKSISAALPYLAWGMVAFVAGTLVRLSPNQSPVNSFQSFYAAPWIVNKEKSRQQAAADEARVKDVGAEARALVEQARRTLRGLRFQQSYSSGWSGALKLPIGLEGGANAAVTFAERQLGLPELVYEYREFVRAATRYYDRVFIAIDELDKLPSDEDAKKFLNGIKAIFGQPKVYYLLSISENALSNFERRGLPIRDEFDSSFDDAVHLSYFDISSSRRLLARRSSQPPPLAYRAYCHVVSGGLPRDLIRSCRKLYDYRRAHPTAENSVAATCTALISRDISAKIEAIRYNLQRVPEEESTATVLALIAVKQWTPTALQDVIYELHHSQHELEERAKGEENSEASANPSLLANIIEELKAYLYFSLAAIVTFQSITSEPSFRKLEQALVFDSLAAARQLLAVNRAAAIGAVHAVVPLPLAPPNS